MLKNIAAGIGMSAFVAVVVLAQGTPPAAPAAPAGGGRGAGRGGGQAAGGRGAAPAGSAALPTAGQVAAAAPANTPTEEQWNKPEVQAFVTKAKTLAGTDPICSTTSPSTAPPRAATSSVAAARR